MLYVAFLFYQFCICRVQWQHQILHMHILKEIYSASLFCKTGLPVRAYENNWRCLWIMDSSSEKTEMIYTAASNIMLKTLGDSVASLIKRPHLSLVQVTWCHTWYHMNCFYGLLLFACLIGTKLYFWWFFFII